MINSIFHVDIEIDLLIDYNNPEPDWKTITYGWMSDKFLEKHNKIKDKFINEDLLFFFQGIIYEYGINLEINLQTALQFYEKGCAVNEPFSLYKLYTIIKKHSNKFNINRDRDKEILLLLRSMAFSDSHYLFNLESIYNFKIIHEVAILIKLEDFNLNKIKQLFENIYSKQNECDRNINDIKFTEAIFLLRFHNIEEEKTNALSLLNYLADEKGHLESHYKLGSLYRREIKNLFNNKDLITSYKHFEVCYKLKYYKAYSDFALLLYQDNNINRCKQIMLEGMENGYPKNLFLYYDIILSTLPDFHSMESISVLKKLLRLLIKDLACGNFFSIFEFIYLHNLIKLNYDHNFKLNTNYIEEIYLIIDKLYKEKASLSDCYKELEIEIILSLAYLNYIGFHGKRNLNFAEELFKEAFKLGKNYTYKRFCQLYLFKLRKKMFDSLVNEPLDSTLEDSIILIKKCELDTARSKLTKTKNKLYKLYIESFKSSEMNSYSSSFFFYMGKIFEKGYGVEKNKIVAHHFYDQSFMYKPRNLGSGSIIIYHQKEKSRIILQNEIFVNIENEIINLKVDSLIASNEKVCEICFSKYKQFIFFPCKHYVCCDECTDKILREMKNCPLCRTKILFIK